jgi:phage gp29-like protein
VPSTSPKIAPKSLPQEHDYLWERAKLGAKPARVHYRDLPIVSTQTFDDVGATRQALLQLEQGQFTAAAQLCDAFGVDDRITGVLQTRVDALTSLPLELSSRTSKKKGAKLATRAQDEWSSWFPDSELKRLLRWGLLLRLGIGELLWETREPGYWAPRLKVWDPRYAYWRWDTRSFWLITLDGPVEITPGDGHWILYAPDGYARGWMNGLVRSLALLFLIRRWATRDWARYSEVHGLPLKKAIVPADAKTEDKEAFERDLRTLGGEGIIRVAKDEQGFGFDLALVEAASQSWQGFQRLIEKSDECIAVDVLGQNLTTSMSKGGSYAAANVHDRIRIDRLESDAKSLGACLADQVMVPWAVYNFGDEKLAPRVSWSTKAVEERSVTAKMLNDLGEALTKLRNAGLNVDRVKVATTFRVPLVEGKPLIEPKPGVEQAAKGAKKPGDGESEAELDAPEGDDAPDGDTDAEQGSGETDA